MAATTARAATPTAAPRQEQPDEEEVFEIREWLDEDGNEVSSELMSVKAAAEEVAKLDLLGALERATAAKQQKPEEGEGRQEKGEAADAQVGDKSSAQRLLDAHDWAGIKARAQELERLQEKKQGGRLDAEADARRGRDKLEGVGWAKGFLNNGGGGGGGGKTGGNEAVAKAKAVQTQQQVAAAAAAAAPSADSPSPSSSPPLTVDANAPPTAVRTATATGMATKKSALSSPEKKRGDRPRKQVSFQLAPEQGADQAARVLGGPLADYHRLVQQPTQLRSGELWGGEEETKEEGKRRLLPPRGPVPFSGRVEEASAAVAAAPASAPTAVAALPTAAAAGIPPGMSRFKARALGLLPPESN